MLAQIIKEEQLGVVIGEAENGVQAIPQIETLAPDIVLIDLLMPELDGIATMEQLKQQQFHGQFIMISQVINKEMVGEAYEKGVEFFIHKPINRIEVKKVLTKVAEQIKLKQSFNFFTNTFQTVPSSEREKDDVTEKCIAIMAKMGMVGEAGTEDIIFIMKYLMEDKERTSLPPLKDLYEQAARSKQTPKDQIQKECKAIEQRIRRALLVAMNHLASLGVTDYMNPEFEHFAPRYFEFDEIRKQMKLIEDGESGGMKGKVNIKKFLHMLYFDLKEKNF